MGLIGRYIFRHLFQAFLLCLVTLIAIVWVSQVVEEFDVITAQGQSFRTFLTMTLLIMPAFVNIIAPVALFIATLYTFNRLNSDSELLVLSAAGAPRRQIIAPFLLLTVIVSVIVGVINISVMPQSLSTLRVLITAVRADLISNVIQPGNFASVDQGITFHIGARTPQGELQGVLIDDSRDSKEQITYVAKRGRILSNSEGSFLVMEDGSVQRQQQNSAERTQIVVFDRYLIDLEQLSNPDPDVLYKPSERPTGFLINPDPEDPYFKAYPGRFGAELHKRLSSPLLPFFLAFLAIANVGFARTTREGRGFATASAVTIAVLAIIVIVTAQNLAAKYILARFALYGVPLLILAIAVPMSFGKFRRRHASALADTAAYTAAWLGERVMSASRLLRRS